MTLPELRNAIADHLTGTLGNPAFIQELRDGLRDDGPYMIGAIVAAEAVEAKWLAQVAPAPEEVE
jgi:hypothetical protein